MKKLTIIIILLIPILVRSNSNYIYFTQQGEGLARVKCNEYFLYETEYGIRYTEYLEIEKISKVNCKNNEKRKLDNYKLSDVTLDNFGNCRVNFWLNEKTHLKALINKCGLKEEWINPKAHYK